MKKYLIRSATIINEGKKEVSDLLIEDNFIAAVGTGITSRDAKEINAEGKLLIPGIIDDQVHFREPGLTHKADIGSEAMAAVAGGVTTFMEMPNTSPPAVTWEELEKKYDIASRSSLANYSFYMGVTNSNAETVLRIDPEKYCGIKIFMGSSTGDMLVDNNRALEKIFSEAPVLIAIHSENDDIIARNLEKYREKYGDDIPAELHPEIRSVAACYDKTEFAVGLARKTGARLHVLHISTEEELAFFSNELPLQQKKITAEACVHHLWFDASDYARLGHKIKCNPAIKEERHRHAILQAVLDDRIDVIATDHAPHTLAEKNNPYVKSPSGLPLVQHSLNLMLEFHHKGLITLEKIVDKMCHKPADLFEIDGRGYIREGYYADLVLVDPQAQWEVSRRNIFYKCGWSPLEGQKFTGKITDTFVSGHRAYSNSLFDISMKGLRLGFSR